MAFSTRTVVSTIMAFAIAAPSLQASVPISTVESYSTIYSEVTPTLPAATPGTQTGCPTVTLTSSICSTCITPACVEIEALTQSCECPGAVPTVFVEFPCNGDNACSGLGCAADYVFFTDSCVASTSTATGSGSGSANTTTSSVSLTGTGGANSTVTGVNGTVVTASITSTASTTSDFSSAAGSGTFIASSASVAMAGVLRPFWMDWI